MFRFEIAFEHILTLSACKHCCALATGECLHPRVRDRTLLCCPRVSIPTVFSSDSWSWSLSDSILAELQLCTQVLGTKSTSGPKDVAAACSGTILAFVFCSQQSGETCGFMPHLMHFPLMMLLDCVAWIVDRKRAPCAGGPSMRNAVLGHLG
jgi:hypothetical protein